MLKYSALIYPEKPDPLSGNERKRIHFPQLNCWEIATVVNYDSKEWMVEWSLLRAIDYMMRDRQNVSLGIAEEEAPNSDLVVQLDWTCKLKILISNRLIILYPGYDFGQIATHLRPYLGDHYDADVLFGSLSVRKKASNYDLGQLLIIASQLDMPIQIEDAKIKTW